MSIELAFAIVVLVALVGNRLLSILIGLLLHVPALWLLPSLYLLDMIQIPFFYWLYENGSAIAVHLPNPFRKWLSRDWSIGYLGRWAAPLGGFGIMVVAALPAFGGGMWSAVFLAYGLHLRKSWSYVWMALGSLVSYLSIFWVMDTLVRTLRYLSVR